MFTHTYTHMHTHMDISHMHTHMHTCIHTHKYAHVHTCTYIYRGMHVHTCTYKQAHAHMHTYMHTHAQSHTHWSSVAGKMQFTSNCISVTFVQGDFPFSILSTLRALWRSRPQYSQQNPDSLSRTIKLPAAPPLSSLNWPQFLRSASPS